MTDELKPCPFCGSKKIRFIGSTGQCISCGTQGPHDGREAWNTRISCDTAAMPEWQLMETAPLNENNILIFEFGFMAVAHRTSGKNSKPGQYSDGDVLCFPTHWMPLPKPPSIKGV